MKRRISTARVPLVLLAWCFVAPAEAQNERCELPHTEVRRLASKSTGIDYVLYVSWPRDYERSGDRYPVVFTLDADYSFALSARVFLCVGERENPPWRRVPMVDDLKHLASVLQSRGYRGLELESAVFPDENHDSVFPAPL